MNAFSASVLFLRGERVTIVGAVFLVMFGFILLAGRRPESGVGLGRWQGMKVLIVVAPIMMLVGAIMMIVGR